MIPSLFSVALKVLQTSRPFKLYENGTIIFETKDSDNSVWDQVKYNANHWNPIAEHKPLIVEYSNSEEYEARVWTYPNTPDICILNVLHKCENLELFTPDQKLNHFKSLFETDYHYRKCILDTSVTPIIDYEPTMYLFVNHSLSMGKGKIAGQVGHAVGHLVAKLVKNPTPEYVDWSFQLHKKVVLKATSDQLQELMKMKDALSICDAGRTQIAAGSQTVVAFPPMYKKDVPDNFKDYKCL